MAHGYPDYEGDKSGLYLKPEWAAKEGTDKNFTYSRGQTPWGGFAQNDYAVPAGKTLYICGMSFYNRSFLAANGDLNQIGVSTIYDVTDLNTLAVLGGNGGGSISFPKPIPIPGGHTVRVYQYNWANHDTAGEVSLWGYET